MQVIAWMVEAGGFKFALTAVFWKPAAQTQPPSKNTAFGGQELIVDRVGGIVGKAEGAGVGSVLGLGVGALATGVEVHRKFIPLPEGKNPGRHIQEIDP